MAVGEAAGRTVKTGQEDKGRRLDIVLAERLDISRSRAQKLIDAGLVKVDGSVHSKSSNLAGGETIEAILPPKASVATKAEPIPLKIVFEDDYLVVLSKPPGMVVHPAPGHPSGTLVNALMAHTKGLSSIGGTDRPGIVHRLDKDTSGLIIAAKTDAAHQGLSEALKKREIKKTYLALVKGGFRDDEGVIGEPVGRHARDRKRMATGGAKGREAFTRWRVKERFKRYTLLEVRPETGRTHQIRVHLAHIGHPIVGDPVYGPDSTVAAKLGLKRQFLHAAGLEFIHPVTGREISLTDGLPPDLQAALLAAEK
ncbi:MAG: RluA family pseudouridine synthase [Actinomycetota bacterium]